MPLALAFAMVMGAVALADQLKTNDLTIVNGNATVTHTAPATGSNTFTVEYELIEQGGDGSPPGANCNVTSTDQGTLSFSGLPAGVAATAGTTWTACGKQDVTFTVQSTVTPNVYSVVPTMSGGVGSYTNHPHATFQLTIHAPSAPADTTAPTVTINLTSPNSGVPNGNSGWFVSKPVLGTVTASDTQTNISELTCTGVSLTGVTGVGTALSASGNFEINAEGTTDISCTAKDSATPTPNESSPATTLTVKLDTVAPTVTCDASDPHFLLNADPANVTATATDATSGPASQSVNAAADTTSVGSKSVTVSATDNAGNQGSAICSYTVGYDFIGFFAPVNNGNFLNSLKAGQAIPLKWRLLDANGDPVTNLTSAAITVVSLACNVGSTVDQLEEVAAGGSGLQNLGDGYYQLNWKSPSSYANSCKTLRLNLSEGIFRTADFQFRK